MNLTELIAPTEFSDQFVARRLKLLRKWQSKFERNMKATSALLQSMSESGDVDEDMGAHLIGHRRVQKMQLVEKPLVFSTDVIREYGYESMHAMLCAQYASMTRKQKDLWMNNFLYVMTPDHRRIFAKIERVLHYKSFGQQRNFMLGGASGSGKTLLLNWFCWCFQPRVGKTSNLVHVLKIDAPVNNKSAIPLLKRFLFALGHHIPGVEETLLNRLLLYSEICGVKLIIIDEIEHIRVHWLKRRILEISNLSPGIPIVIASCDPVNWIGTDTEINGRWKDRPYLTPYKGEKLIGLLSFLELALPLSAPSYLPHMEIKASKKKNDFIPGPAKLIEEMTDGILRDIMLLLIDATNRCLDSNLPRITPELLVATWDDIQTDGYPTGLEG